MKILRIQGKNLASIAGEFEIDFTREPLRSAGIFAICGPTGSGKSTVLDAVCLALFNNTPRTTGIENTRMPDIGRESILQGDRRQILRRGTAEAVAAVEFIAVDGKIYRSVWRVRRANNKPTGKLQPAELRVYDPDTNTPITTGIGEAENKLIQLTGLTYNQFTRTVLLAQNEFARFLKARKDEKAEVLEKLTGTEIYSIISNQVYTRTADIRSEWKVLNDRISHIQLLTEDEQTQLVREAEMLRNQAKALQQKDESILHKIKWHEQLAQLQQSRDEAEKSLQTHLHEQEEAVPRAERLLLTDRVEDSRRLWQRQNELLQQQHSCRQLLQQCSDTLTAVTAETEILQNRVRKQQEHLEQETLEYNRQKPALQQARQLDLEIGNAAVQLESCQKSHRTVHQAISEQEKLKNERETQLNETHTKLAGVRKWFERNRQHEYLCRNLPLIKGCLDTAHQASLQMAQLEKHLAETRTASARTEKQQLALNRQSEQLKKDHESLTRQAQQLHEQTESTDITAIRKNRNALQLQREGLLQSLMLWQNCSRIRQELEEAEKNLLAKREWSGHLRMQEQELNPRLAAARIQFTTARQLLEKARLAASAHVSALRRQLEPNSPCPVCGSTDHPYAGSHPPLLEPLQAETVSYEKAYRTLETEQVRLASEIKHQEEAADQLAQNIQSLRKRCEEADAGWKARASALGLPFSITNQEIELQISHRTDQLREIGKAEENWEKRTLALRELEQHITHNRSKLDRCHAASEQLHQTDIQLKNAMAKDQGLLENLHRQHRDALERIAGQISIPDWKQRWQTQYATFREELNRAASQWQEQEKQQEDLEKQETRLSSSLQEKARQLAQLKQNETEVSALLTQSMEQLHQLQEKRHALFEGQPTEAIEKYWQENLENIRQEIRKDNQEKERSMTRMAQMQGQHEQLASSLRQTEADLQTVSRQLENRMRTYHTNDRQPVTPELLGELLSAEPSFLQSEREYLNRLRDRITAARTTLYERETQLNRHLQSEHRPDTQTEPLPELQAQLQQLRMEQTQTAEQRTRVTALLHTQQENLRQSEDLRQQLAETSRQLERWSKLDDLIGSQSGYKFKEIAQGYTLDILLSYANKQLRELTSRYQLQRIPNELALQIIDHDLCDEVRSVFSLSGGESFLVSLALALGLSSFASRNHYEENLFIDEGFGTLDADTLQMVMEALERLRSQGRQVGIISHVQELTERIPARICLTKTGNGKSKIEVNGTHE